MKFKKLYFALILLSFSVSFINFPLLSQTQHRILGQVLDANSNEPLPGTLIKVEQTRFFTFSDEQGKFIIPDLESGTYMLICILATYPRYMLSVHVPAQGDTSIKIMLAETGTARDVFELGGLIVETERELLPREYTATTRISSGEIENLQASSLGDVLEMVPGLEKSNRLGLDRAIYANIRGSANDMLGAFGTKIILDEAPLSNNANMQMHAGGTVTSSAGNGIDLRLIPADNIESVEIIRGVPSAKYGDLTSGIIKVKTKTGIRSPRIKIKSNPNTTEANFGTGFKAGKNLINVNFNYGFSERSLRKEGDEFHRINATFITQRPFLNDKLPVNWKLFMTRLLDEEKPTDVLSTSSYNRGYTINSDWWGSYSPNNLEKYKASIYFHYTRQNTYRSRMVIADPHNYMGELRMYGDEINIGGRLEASRKLLLSHQLHELLAGMQFQYDDNFGKGVVIDSLNNYYGPNSSQRSYSFSEVPSLSQVSFYLEDRFTGKLWKEYTIVLGLRYDLFKPRRIDFNGLWERGEFIQTQHGSFLSPRIGWMIYFSPTTQLGGGFGTSAKIPSMAYIFIPPESKQYQFNFYSYDQSNYHLRGYYLKEIKLGLDKKFFNMISVSLEGYFSWRNDEPRGRYYPFFYEINPDTTGVPTYVKHENIGWKKQQGFEASLTTKSYKGVSFKINGTYRYTLSGEDVLTYNSNPAPIDTDGDGINDSRDPVWQDHKDRWWSKWIIDYRLEYRSPILGLWFQLIAQQIPLYQTKSNDPYERGFWANYLKKYPDNWVFNFRLSKSLWWGSEVSLYVNNFLDDRGIYAVPWEREYYPNTGTWGRRVYQSRNNAIFWGFEFSTKFDFK